MGGSDAAGSDGVCDVGGDGGGDGGADGSSDGGGEDGSDGDGEPVQTDSSETPSRDSMETSVSIVQMHSSPPLQSLHCQAWHPPPGRVTWHALTRTPIPHEGHI